jgi:glycosyltransferase involved in cell wall biosynthesis
MRKSLSIVIPVYNEERYLGACLDAIACQTVMPDEVVVVDNNCTDKTIEIAQKYGFVKIVREKRQGRMFARARGMEAAKNEWLAWLDADTRLPEDWVEVLMGTAERRPAAAAITGRGVFYDAPAPKFFGLLQVWFYQYLQFPAMRGYTLWGANMALKRDAWRDIKTACQMRNDIDEDIDVSLQLHKKHLAVIYEPSLCVANSLRRDQTNPVEVARYMSTWPRDYIVNRRLGAAAYISVVTLLVVALSSAAWLFLFFFPRQRR